MAQCQAAFPRMLALVATLLALAPPASAGVDAFYATLAFRESPYAPHLGLRPLTAAQAEARNHYRFRRDGSGRIEEVRFVLGERLRAPNHTANYFWYAAREVHRFEQDEEIVTWHDEADERTTVQGSVWEARYRLDEQGRRTALAYFGTDGLPVESRWGITRYAWRHGDDGTVVEDRFDLGGEPVTIRPGFPFHRIRLSYGAGGETRLMQHVDGAGTVIEGEPGFAQDRFTYLPSGELARYDVLDRDGGRGRNMTGVASGVTRYTDFGYEQHSRYEDAAGRPAYNEHGWWRSERRYDGVGNLVLNAFRDADGQPMINPEAGYAEARIAWHDDGLRRRSLRYFDAAGEPVAHRTRGYHSVSYGYDDQARLRGITLRDVAGRLVDHGQQGWAVRSYPAAGGGPESLTAAQARQRGLATLVDALRDTVGVPGLAVALATHGELHATAVAGVADIGTDRAITPDTVFRLASVSKAVTAIVIARALDRDELSLADPASRWTAIDRPATLAQLLAHTGAVDHYRGPGHAADGRYATASDALATVTERLLPWDPGTRYRYSTFGYTLASAMLERAAGRSFPELVSELAVAAGTPSLRAPRTGATIPEATRFFAVAGTRVVPARPRDFSYAFAGAGLVANAPDLARLVSRFAAGELSSASARDAMLTVQRLADGSVVADRGYEVALGWRRQADLAGRPAFHHAGVTDGARSIALFDPATTEAVAVLSNAAWTGDLFHTALALVATHRDGPRDLVEAADPGTVIPLEVGAVRWNGIHQEAELRVDPELRAWLARSERPPVLRLVATPASCTLVSPYGLSPVFRATSRQRISRIGSRTIGFRLPPGLEC